MILAFVLSGLASFAFGLVGLGRINSITLLAFLPALWKILPVIQDKFRLFWWGGERSGIGEEAEWRQTYLICLVGAFIPFMLHGVTEGDSLMYHIPLSARTVWKLTIPCDNIVTFYPHLYESFMSPFLRVFGDRAFTAVNSGVIVWMASVHPVGALMGYLMMLVPSAKPDMLAAALVAAAYLSRGWIALGIAAGAAYSCKMSALVFLLPLLAMRPKALMIVVLMALPWSAYSLYCLGNPIFPAGAGFFLTAGWSREMSDTWGLAGNWMVNPGGLVKAMLYACPMIPLALFTPSPWPVMIALGLALVLLPAEGRYLLPATAALAAMKPVMEARGRIILMVAGCVAVLWQGLHAVHAPLDLLGQVSRVLPRKVLTIGEARKWPHLMRGADCQGLNDPPIARDVVRASRDTEDIRKKLVRQRGYRTILANRSICGNWPREMAKFRWTDREVLLWSDFIRNHTVLAGVVGKGDTQSGELAVFLLDGKGKRPDKPDVPGLEGEIWLLARGLR